MLLFSCHLPYTLRFCLKALRVAPRKAVRGLLRVFTMHLTTGYGMQNSTSSTSEQSPKQPGLQAGLVIGRVSLWRLRGGAAAARRCCLTPKVIKGNTGGAAGARFYTPIAALSAGFPRHPCDGCCSHWPCILQVYLCPLLQAELRQKLPSLL